MNAKVPDTLAIIMFMYSMSGFFHATIAALRTMSESSLRWDTVTSRLIEEYHNNPRRGAPSGHGASAHVVHAPSVGCGESMRRTEDMDAQKDAGWHKSRGDNNARFLLQMNTSEIEV